MAAHPHAQRGGAFLWLLVIAAAVVLLAARKSRPPSSETLNNTENKEQRLRQRKVTPQECFWSFSHANDDIPDIPLNDFVGADRFIGAAYCVSAAGLLHFLQQQQLHLHLLRLDLSLTMVLLNKNHHHISPKTSYRSRSIAEE